MPRAFSFRLIPTKHRYHLLVQRCLQPLAGPENRNLPRSDLDGLAGLGVVTRESAPIGYREGPEVRDGDLFPSKETILDGLEEDGDVVGGVSLGDAGASSKLLNEFGLVHGYLRYMGQ
jgi:hypothetical protein